MKKDKNNVRPMGINLTQEMFSRIERICNQTGMTKSFFIKLCISHCFEHIDNNDNILPLIK